MDREEIFETDILDPVTVQVECGYCGQSFDSTQMAEIDEDGQSGACYSCLASEREGYER
jgi:hypothetical protein